MSLLVPGRPARDATGLHQSTGPWAAVFAVRHAAAVAILALVLTAATLRGGAVAATDGATALLVCGALIGLPHGSADFVVAWRWMCPRFGTTWLPLFLTGYLAIVLVVAAAWFFLPLPTLLVFLLGSMLHFAAEDMEGARPGLRPLVVLARAATPLVPMVLFHAGAVAPYIAALARVDEPMVLGLLASARPVVGPLWAVTVAIGVLGELRSRESALGGARAAELFGLALAAVALPPLMSFALYFCFSHATRHMAGLVAEQHPRSPSRALSLAAAVLVPSALLCGVALLFCWSNLGGLWSTDTVVVGALRVVATLTAPHMLLAALSRHPLEPARTR